MSSSGKETDLNSHFDINAIIALSEHEAAARLKREGLNELPSSKQRSILTRTGAERSLSSGPVQVLGPAPDRHIHLCCSRGVQRTVVRGHEDGESSRERGKPVHFVSGEHWFSDMML